MARLPNRRAAAACVAASVLAVASVAQVAQDRPASRPNVLFLLADDLGWTDVGFNNADTFYETPNLDRLAGGGMRFTQAYAACPVCSPTRASLLTGRYPARMATTDYFGAPQPEAVLAAAKKGRGLGRFRRLPLLPASYVNRLPHERVTLAEALRDRGYATFFAGKWHLGGDGFSPLEQGFDVNIAGHHRGGPYGPGKYFHPFGMPNLESKPGDHLPARLAEETVAFLREHKSEPWFAMLSFYSVHTPLMGREDLVERYKRKRSELGLEARWAREGERRVRQVQEHAVYAAMVHAMDEAVGSVLTALDELGLADDTIVVFFSDNGGLSTSEGHPTSNLPLRAGKGWLYEGGIREPCVVRWPGRIEAGSTSDAPIVSTDFAPTVLDAVGGPRLREEFVDGESLLPLLEGGKAPERDALYWHYPHWGNQGGTPGGAIRAGDWKWIEFFTPGKPGELYNLAADIGEQRDLAATEPARVEQLRTRLRQWRAEVGARMPAPNPLLVAPADRWARFRGPNGKGVAEVKGLPVEFGPEKNVLWKADLPAGHSSPVVWGSMVFATAFEEDDLYTYCLDSGSGAVRWRKSVVRTRRVANLDRRNNAASPTPAVDGDTVVAFFEDYGLVAYNHAGKKRWELKLGPFNNVYGMGASPVLVDGRVFLVCDQQTNSYVLAVAKRDGAELWRTARESATSGHCTPVVYRPPTGPAQLIVPGSFLLDAYDTRSGERVWWVRGLCFEMKSTPVLHEGVVYINGYGSPMNQPGNQITVSTFEDAIAEHDADKDGAISKNEMPRSRARGFFSFVDLAGDGALDAADWRYLRNALAAKNGMLAITAGGRGDRTAEAVLWSYHRSVPQLPSPLLYRDVLYMLNDQSGLLTTLRPRSGEVIERGRLEKAIDNYYASPVAADGKVYCVSEGGLVSVLAAGDKLETLAVNELGERCYTTPAIAGGRLFIRTVSALYCFAAKK